MRKFIHAAATLECPKCCGPLCHSRVRAWEFWLRYLKVRPRRCGDCRARFYHYHPHSSAQKS